MAARKPPERKELIRCAAAELFRARGFRNVTVTEVADAVGITAPGLYRHYENKQALLLDVVVQELDAVAGAARNAESFDGLLASLAALHTAYRGLGALWQRESRHLDDEYRAVIREHARGAASELLRLSLLRRPELERRDALLVTLAVIGVFTTRRSTGRPLPRRRFEPLLIRLAEAVAGTEFVAESKQAADEPDLATGSADNATAAAGASIGAGRLPRRELLFAEAIRLFDERGFQSVGLADVAEAAGVVRTAVYRHFSSKTDLLAAASAAAGARMRQGMSDALELAREPEQALELLVGAHVDMAMRDSALLGILRHERDQLPDRERKRFRRFQQETMDQWLQAFGNAMPGRDPAEARVAIRAAHAMIFFVVRTDAVNSRPDLRDRLTEFGMALLRSR